MFNLLIVDDELHTVEGVKAAVNWESLQILKVFSAYNIRQAKEVFVANTIDIVLCDMEMPQGNGLELLSWMKDAHPKTEFIVLTCHDEFNYLKASMHLGCIDYILKPVKPVELKETVIKAIDTINHKKKTEKYIEYGETWLKHKSSISEKFWLDLIMQKIPSDMDDIKRAAKTCDIYFDEKLKSIPIFIEIQRYHKETSHQDERLVEFAVKNVAEEVIMKNGTVGSVIQIKPSLMLGIFVVNNSIQYSVKNLKDDCKYFITTFCKYFACDICCYIGDEVYIDKFENAFEKLHVLMSNNVAFSNEVILLNDPFISYEKNTDADSNTDSSINIWIILLEEGDLEKVLTNVKYFFEQLMKDSELNLKTLVQFQQDFIQAVYIYIYQKGLQAHKLFIDDNSVKLHLNANANVSNMLLWVKHILQRTYEYTNMAATSKTMIDRVKTYISEHISEKLSCKDIANHIYLNPDYLTKCFKKETGMTISKYLLQERMKIAKVMLENSGIPISKISTFLCYDSFSHFSNVFKNTFGMTPNHYRKLHIPSDQNNNLLMQIESKPNVKSSVRS